MDDESDNNSSELEPVTDDEVRRVAAANAERWRATLALLAQH
jgi:hypothetical protein